MPALEYVTLTGTIGAIVVDYVDADTHPDEQVVSGFCDLFPRRPAGEVLWADVTPRRGLTLAPFRTRFDISQGGQLKTIVGTAVEILACNDAIPLDELVYDLVFSEVRYNRATQYIAPFAIRTLTATGTIDLADPDLERLKPTANIKPLPTPL